MARGQIEHNGRSARLDAYDYAQAGAYFATICTQHRALFFQNEAIKQIAETCWRAIPEHHAGVLLDEWVVMPNHTHGIIVIDANDDTHRRGVQLNAPTMNFDDLQRDPANQFSVMSPQRGTLSVIIRTYKAAVTTLCRRQGIEMFAWQRNFYERVIRNDDELQSVRQYIIDNPARWSGNE